MIENTFGIDILPENEDDRLEALRRYKITDTPSEKSFDGIARLATQIFNVPIALLSLVDAETVFFKANVGMGLSKSADRGKSLCALAVLDEEVTVFEDALREPCLMANPNVIGAFGLRFYAGAPLITHDGFLIGTLCIIDKSAREFNEEQRQILEGLAATAMAQIELRRSAIDKIAELKQANAELKSAKIDLVTSNNEIESTNEKLTSVNHKLSKSSTLTIELNQRLQKSEQRLKSFISKAPVAFGILTGRELKIEVANDMILKVWGKTYQVIGMPLAVGLPELKGQPYLAILDEVYTSGKTYVGDTAYVELEFNGEMKGAYFDFIYEPLKNESGLTESIIVIANEVTDRIKKSKQLEELNQQFEIALHAGQLGSYNLNLKTGEMISSEICRTNYDVQEGEKFDFDELLEKIVPEYRAIVKSKVEEAIKDNSIYNAEYPIKWKDGSVHWMSASGLPSYDHVGIATNMIGVTLDITERKNYETQKDNFLGIASHELKTPITSLKASIQLLERLKDQTINPILPRLIDQAAVSLKKLSVLVDDLLNMHRISEGQLRLKKQMFAVSKMLAQSCDAVRASGKHNLIISGDLDIEVYADEHRIDQVVVNFVNNAVKYAPNSTDIHILIEVEKNFVKIVVKDQGDGIDPAIQPFIFDRYYRADHQGENYSGLGLGLYISSEIIKKHGGEIGVDSELGKGSSFWFSIPLI